MELEACASNLIAQAYKAQQEAEVAFEEVAVAGEAQWVEVQAGFKVLRQLLLQLEPSFNIQSLEALVTPEIVEIVVAKVKAKVAIKQKVEAGKEATAEEGTAAEVAAGREVAVQGVAVTGEATQEIAIEQEPEGAIEEVKTMGVTLEDRVS